jgi:hypothetical protein
MTAAQRRRLARAAEAVLADESSDERMGRLIQAWSDTADDAAVAQLHEAVKLAQAGHEADARKKAAPRDRLSPTDVARLDQAGPTGRPGQR